MTKNTTQLGYMVVIRKINIRRLVGGLSEGCQATQKNML
jgi:hypothetical protein